MNFGLAFFVCVHGNQPGGESQLWGFVVASQYPRAKVSIARWNLKSEYRQ
jgi:hypothetical protein